MNKQHERDINDLKDQILAGAFLPVTDEEYNKLIEAMPEFSGLVSAYNPSMNDRKLLAFKIFPCHKVTVTSAGYIWYESGLLKPFATCHQSLVENPINLEASKVTAQEFYNKLPAPKMLLHEYNNDGQMVIKSIQRHNNATGKIDYWG